MTWWEKVWNSWRLSKPSAPTSKAASKPTSGACPECGRRLRITTKEAPREVITLVTLMCPMCDKVWGPYSL